jgi:glutathione S-transferase
MIPATVAGAGRRLVLLGPAWTRSFRCAWMMEELGLKYQIDSKAMPVSKAVRQHVSTGKVPVLLEFDGNNEVMSQEEESSRQPSFVLSESSAINTYLCDQYGGVELNLIPPTGTRERAKYDETVSCITTELDCQGLWLHRKHNADIPEAVTAARKQFERINRHLAQQLNPYLLGQHFTAADVLYVHCLDWSKGIGWHDQWPEHLEKYRKLCQQRPAYQRAKLQRDAEKTAAKSRISSDTSIQAERSKL